MAELPLRMACRVRQPVPHSPTSPPPFGQPTLGSAPQIVEESLIAQQSLVSAILATSDTVQQTAAVRPCSRWGYLCGRCGGCCCCCHCRECVWSCDSSLASLSRIYNTQVPISSPSKSLPPHYDVRSLRSFGSLFICRTVSTMRGLT